MTGHVKGARSRIFLSVTELVCAVVCDRSKPPGSGDDAALPSADECKNLNNKFLF